MRSKTVTKIISLIVINALTALLIFQVNFAGGKSSPTQAQTTGNYSAVWSAKQCRKLNSFFVIGNGNVNVTLGVAEWNVSYKINGVDNAIQEKWIATGWTDVPQNGSKTIIDNQLSGPVTNRVSSLYSTTNCDTTRVYHTSAGSNWLVATGLYGWSAASSVQINIDTTTGYNLIDGWSAGASYPTGWTVCKTDSSYNCL